MQCRLQKFAKTMELVELCLSEATPEDVESAAGLIDTLERLSSCTEDEAKV